WPDVSITEASFRHAGRLADRSAIVDGITGRGYTYAQLHGAVRRFAAGLQARGLGKGDVGAILSPNLPEYPIAFHRPGTRGMNATTHTPLYTGDEFRSQLRASRARMIVTVPPLLDKARAAAEGTSVEEIVVFGEAEGATSLASLLAAGESDQVAVDPARDLAA